MAKKILLLGSTGKMGNAISRVFSNGYTLINKNSRDFNAADFRQTKKLIRENKPDIVINTVALLGVDPCETDPQKALVLNSLYPKLLAELSKEKGFLLVHFSTDAVFDGAKKDFYCEDDLPCPLNIYGLTKYGGDCFIQAAAGHYYIFRISVLFGRTPKNTQFVEKMLEKARAGNGTIRVSADIIVSPTYSLDAAKQLRQIIESRYPYGLYHIANKGKASLYELMKEISKGLKLKAKVEKASHKDFPSIGIKNAFTPLRSKKLKPLRPWQQAVKDYCKESKGGPCGG